MKKLIPLICIVFVSVSLVIVYNMYFRQPSSLASTSRLETPSTPNYFALLNLDEGKERSRRQIEIVMNTPSPPLNPNLTPVHILARPSEKFHWRVWGSGALTNAHPGYLVTAAHVVSGQEKLQFGYRVVCKNALTGTEPILPVLSCDLGCAPGDIALCKVGTSVNAYFPTLVYPQKEVSLRPDKDGRNTAPSTILLTYKADQGKVTLITDGRSFNCLLSATSTIGEDFVFWPDENMFAGESGSLAEYEVAGQKSNVIVIGGVEVGEELRKSFKLEKKELAVGLRVLLK